MVVFVLYFVGELCVGFGRYFWKYYKGLWFVLSRGQLCPQLWDMGLIKNWLDGQRNFLIGRNILKVYGDNPAILDLLDGNETPFRLELLTSELQRLYNESIAPGTITMVVPGLKQEKPEEEKPHVISVDDPVLISLQKQVEPLYNKLKFFHNQLAKYGARNDTSTIQACFPICRDIVKLRKECQEIWSQRDYYKLHGTLPETKLVEVGIPTDPLELARFIDAKGKAIRRYKNKNNPEAALKLLENQRLYKLATGKDYVFAKQKN